MNPLIEAFSYGERLEFLLPLAICWEKHPLSYFVCMKQLYDEILPVDSITCTSTGDT